jgi:hypothetical protein
MKQNMTRKLLSIITLLCLTVSSAWAWSGSGTSRSPYQIANASDLNQLASNVNNATASGDDDAYNGYEGKYFVLTKDISRIVLNFDEETTDIDNAQRSMFNVLSGIRWMV